MLWISLLYGSMIGLSLGLTGGGGAIFAVPLLVYGVGVATQDAVGISLAAVGTTSLVGFLHRMKLGQVELQTGLLFAAAGMLGTPFGSWFGSRLPESLLLLMFAGLMVVVAVRLWLRAATTAAPAAAEPDIGGASADCRPKIQPPEACPVSPEQDQPTCRRDGAGRLILSSRCAVLLMFVGVLTGVLAGMFGVGGGFVIVPALVLFSGMSMHKAVGTSLMVVALVSVSGVTSHLWSGRDIPLVLTSLFVLGGIAGLFAGQSLGRRLSAAMLQRVFAVVILLVAAFVIVRNVAA